mgnify:CR=1 FL=1
MGAPVAAGANERRDVLSGPILRSMRVGVLGPAEVSLGDGTPVDLGTRKQRALLAALAMHRGRPVAVDTLVDLLWADRPPAGVSGTLQAYVAGLRKALDLYANLRPVRNLPGVPSRFQNVDLVIVRENTEDLYSGLEHVVVPGVVESLKIITEVASTRIAVFAFVCPETRDHVGQFRIVARRLEHTLPFVGVLAADHAVGARGHAVQASAECLSRARRRFRRSAATRRARTRARRGRAEG